MKTLLIICAVHMLVCLALAALLSNRSADASLKTEITHSVAQKKATNSRTSGVILTGHTDTVYFTSYHIPTALVVYFLAGLVALLSYGIVDSTR